MTGLLAVAGIGIALFALFGGRKRRAPPEELPPAPPPIPGPAPEPPPGDVVTPEVPDTDPFAMGDPENIRGVQWFINEVLMGLSPPREPITVDGKVGPQTCGAHEWLVRNGHLSPMLDCTGISSTRVPPIRQGAAPAPGASPAQRGAWPRLLNEELDRFVRECGQRMNIDWDQARAIGSPALSIFETRFSESGDPIASYDAAIGYLRSVCPGWR